MVKSLSDLNICKRGSKTICIVSHAFFILFLFLAVIFVWSLTSYLRIFRSQSVVTIVGKGWQKISLCQEHMGKTLIEGQGITGKNNEVAERKVHLKDFWYIYLQKILTFSSQMHYAHFIASNSNYPTRNTWLCLRILQSWNSLRIQEHSFQRLLTNS